jgi:threonine dehydrogenase-like Zn-dependent dehydrogenase
MRGTILYGPHDVRFEERPDPTIIEPTDAIIRMSATCVCGSDLWSYRGIDQVTQPVAMGHEYVGIVEEVGSAVRNIKVGQFVISMKIEPARTEHTPRGSMATTTNTTNRNSRPNEGRNRW